MDVEVRRERILAPVRRPDLLARLSHPRIVAADGDKVSVAEGERVLEYGHEELVCLPGRTREEFVVGREAAALILAYGDRAGDGPATDNAHARNRLLDGPLGRSLLREDRLPPL